MGIFEYLGVLVSVIMGLGITHLATGATKLISTVKMSDSICRTRCGP